jgi:hypothetical protein
MLEKKKIARKKKKKKKKKKKDRGRVMELSCLKLKLTVDRLISPLQIVTWPLIKTLIKSWNTWPLIKGSSISCCTSNKT